MPAHDFVRRRDRRRRPQRPGRRRLPGPRRTVRAGPGAARTTPAAPPSPPAPSPGSTPGCRATRTWSACCPAKIVRDLGLDFAVRKRTVSSYTPAERGGRPTGLLVGGGERRTRESFARLTGVGPGVRVLAALLRHDRPRRRAGLPDPHRTAAHPRRHCARRVDDEDGLADALRGADRRGGRASGSPTTSYGAWSSPTP